MPPNQKVSRLSSWRVKARVFRPQWLGTELQVRFGEGVCPCAAAQRKEERSNAGLKHKLGSRKTVKPRAINGYSPAAERRVAYNPLTWAAAVTKSRRSGAPLLPVLGAGREGSHWMGGGPMTSAVVVRLLPRQRPPQRYLDAEKTATLADHFDHPENPSATSWPQLKSEAAVESVVRRDQSALERRNLFLTSFAQAAADKHVIIPYIVGRHFQIPRIAKLVAWKCVETCP